MTEPFKKPSPKIIPEQLEELRKIERNYDDEFVSGYNDALDDVLEVFDGLVAELQKIEQNPNIHCNNCKDISAQNLLSYVLGLLEK